jgi:hypothetical protein
MEILDYLKRVGGVARSAQLLDAGFSRRDLLRLNELGATQPRHGVFALPDCDEALHAAIRHNGRLTCASAAAHYGLWLRQPPERRHLACNHGHGNGFIRHRTVRFPGHPLMPIAAVEDVALHALGCLAPPASIAMATSAIRLHGVSRDLLADQLRADRSGTALRTLRDRDRNNAATIKGFAVLRYMPEHIWFSPDRVAAEIKAVLADRARLIPQGPCGPAQLLQDI